MSIFYTFNRRIRDRLETVLGISYSYFFNCINWFKNNSQKEGFFKNYDVLFILEGLIKLNIITCRKLTGETKQPRLSEKNCCRIELWKDL